ncbi:STAS domain-containing protein [Omnitrophica bacterium]|nr:STAS domain-containing protein [Candidatus Omnitrophota bacterium]
MKGEMSMDGSFYKVHKEKDVTILTLTLGNITMQETEGLKRGFSALLKEGSKNIVLDFSGTTFISSVVLASLVFMLKQTKEAGGDLVICGAKGRVKDVIVMTNLHKVFNLFNDTQEAKSHFSKK